jgi:uncharacterized repeat protein (TIGR02543 family)
VTVTSGSSLGFLPEEPTKDGHTFGHWATLPDGEGEPFTASTAVTADITVHAKWLLNAYEVAFDAAGGSVQPQFQRVDHGARLDGGLLPTPARSGHTFDGWYTEQDGGGDEFTASTVVTANMTIYARWIPQYMVTFDTDGGDPVPSPVTITSGLSIGSLPPAPAKTGHTFDGWYTAANGGGDEFTAGTRVTGHMIVYAKWTINQYKVTFDAAGGNVSPPPVTVNYNTPLDSKMPSNPAKTGHAFGGWYTATNGGGDPFTASTTVTADVTVYAKWTIIPYTLTFNPDGGNVSPATRTVNYNSPLGALLPVATKPEYTFGGWYTAADGGGDPFTASTAVTADITVYARWTINQYTVTFNAREGSVSPSTRTAEYNTPLGTLPTPTRSGHTFGGWYTAANGGGDPFIASTKVTADITVYAKWTINPYTVTFNPDGGNVSPATRTVNYNTPLGALLPVATKQEYIFDGWYTAANGGGALFTASTPVTAHITVYAKWLATVKFDTDGGSAAPPPVTVAIGSSINSLPAAPTKTGHAFGGWYTNRNGGGDPFTASTKVTGSKTVYAKWIRQYIVTFNANGGSVSLSSRTVNHDNQIGALPTPTRSGNTFDGWFSNADGTGTRITETTRVTADRTVYAKWLAKVTFNAEGGSVSPASVTVTSGSLLNGLLPAPTKNKYRFGGWYTAANGGGTAFTASTPVTADRTVYAKWTIAADSLPAVIEWINSNAVERGNYTYTLTRNETVTSIMFDQKKVSITLEGDSTERIVDFTNTAVDLFAVDKDVTLTLGNNITLRGRDNSPKSLIVVCRDGHLVMNAGSKICDNKVSGNGGGIYLVGTFTMNGGIITNNTAADGGGIFYLRRFTMNGGEISGNTATNNGGGVFAYSGGPPTMNGGTISGNTPNDVAP